MATKKHITTDDLAVMVQKGFKGLEDKMDERFTQVDERFTQMDERFTQVDERFTQVDERFMQINGKFSKLESDISELRSRMSSIENRMGNMEEILEDHSEEFRFIHKKIDEWTDPRSKKRLVTYDEFTKLESRIAELEKKISVKK